MLLFFILFGEKDQNSILQSINGKTTVQMIMQIDVITVVISVNLNMLFKVIGQRSAQ